MMNLDSAPLIILLISFIWILIQAVIAFSGLRISEGFIRSTTKAYCILIILLNAAVFTDLAIKGSSYTISLPDWFSIANYKLTSDFYIDYYGGLFALLSSFLFAIIARFSFSYFH